MGCLLFKESKLNFLENLKTEGYINNRRELTFEKDVHKYLNDLLNRLNLNYDLNLKTLATIEEVKIKTGKDFSRDSEKFILTPIEESFEQIDNRRKELGIYEDRISIGEYNKTQSEKINNQEGINVNLYSQYLESLNKPNTNPILQGNPEIVLDKQVKGRTEQELIDYLKQKYPEIKLNITNNPVWEQGDNVFNQEEYNNQVNYRLKAVDILLSDKAKQIFDKGIKNNWKLDKVLDEIGGFGNRTGYRELFTQEQLNSSVKNLDRDQLALDIASNYSYTVEINTAKEKSSMTKEIKSASGFSINGDIYDRTTDEDIFGVGDKEIFTKNNKEISEQEYRDALFEYNNRIETPTQYYSNLTVPGGTNYTENEIATPAITPSIKGHAQFSTDNGIGWFRSDDKHAFTGFLEDLIASGTIKKVPCG